VSRTRRDRRPIDFERWGRTPGGSSARRPRAVTTLASVAVLVLALLTASLADASTVVRSVAAEGRLPTATDNDFLRLDAALQAAVSGDVILLEGLFDWSEPHALASWALGSDGAAGTADDYRLSVPSGLDAVTLAPSSPGAAAVAGPGDVPEHDGESCLFFVGPSHDWTLRDLVFLDFDVAVAFSKAATATFDGTTFTRSFVRVATDLNTDQAPLDRFPNYGLQLAAGRGQTITDNVFEIPGTGGGTGTAASKSVGILLQSTGDSAGYDGLLVEANTFQVSGLPLGRAAGGELVGGFEDLSGAHASNIVVRNNRFLNLDPANVSLDNRETAFRVHAHSGPGSTVLYEGNRVEGAEVGVLWTLGGDLSAFDPIRFVGNTFIDGDRAFVVGSGGSAVLRCNRIIDHTRAIDILRNDGSVSAERNWWGCNGGPDAPGCVPLTLSGTGPIPVVPWLVLSVQESVVGAGQTAPLSAGFTTDSDGMLVAECSVPDGISVGFAVAEGTISPAEAGTADGLATVLYTAKKSGPKGAVDVTVQADGEVVSGSIQVVPPGQGTQ